jgi:hypothetical protein
MLSSKRYARVGLLALGAGSATPRNVKFTIVGRAAAGQQF